MGLLDKVKNILFDEEEIEIPEIKAEPKKELKKEPRREIKKEEENPIKEIKILVIENINLKQHLHFQ